MFWTGSYTIGLPSLLSPPLRLLLLRRYSSELASAVAAFAVGTLGTYLTVRGIADDTERIDTIRDDIYGDQIPYRLWREEVTVRLVPFVGEMRSFLRGRGGDRDAYSIVQSFDDAFWVRWY